jgi:hypothetical protein
VNLKLSNFEKYNFLQNSKLILAKRSYVLPPLEAGGRQKYVQKDMNHRRPYSPIFCHRRAACWRPLKVRQNGRQLLELSPKAAGYCIHHWAEAATASFVAMLGGRWN